MIDVTDLYDAWFELAAAIWRRFEFQGRGFATSGQIGPRFDEIVDQLEVDLFLPACARRLTRVTGQFATVEEVTQRLVLCAPDGTALPGKAGIYGTHGFDYGLPTDDEVQNLIVGADLVPRQRPEVRVSLIVERVT